MSTLDPFDDEGYVLPTMETGDKGPVHDDVPIAAWQCTCGLRTLDREQWENHMCPASESLDLINHPPHYTSHPSGVECIQITRHMGNNLGNVIKYVWRADLKGDSLDDLRKARFYLNDEIALREGRYGPV